MSIVLWILYHCTWLLLLISRLIELGRVLDLCQHPCTALLLNALCVARSDRLEPLRVVCLSCFDRQISWSNLSSWWAVSELLTQSTSLSHQSSSTRSSLASSRTLWPSLIELCPTYSSLSTDWSSLTSRSPVLSRTLYLNWICFPYWNLSSFLMMSALTTWSFTRHSRLLRLTRYVLRLVPRSHSWIYVASWLR